MQCHSITAIVQTNLVASGAHTLGRVHKDRSGFGQESTKYTKDGPGTPGGSSWTIDWLKFDNSYFTVSPSLLDLPVPLVRVQSSNAAGPLTGSNWTTPTSQQVSLGLRHMIFVNAKIPW